MGDDLKPSFSTDCTFKLTEAVEKIEELISRFDVFSTKLDLLLNSGLKDHKEKTIAKVEKKDVFLYDFVAYVKGREMEGTDCVSYSIDIYRADKKDRALTLITSFEYKASFDVEGITSAVIVNKVTYAIAFMNPTASILISGLDNQPNPIHFHESDKTTVDYE